MRFVIKKDSDRTAKLSSTNTLELIKTITITKNKKLISDKIYRDSYDTPKGRRSYVEDQLAISYHNKCAYCERICKADIEHYRPKKAVFEEKKHEGYYWLCYEWSNLIPSCITCNREGSKHNKFPILGDRVFTPPFNNKKGIDFSKFKANCLELSNEKPYLLHPEVDDPEDYFKFKINKEKNGIEIYGIDKEGRGKKTIDICLLSRQELELDRRTVIQEVLTMLNLLFRLHTQHQDVNRLFEDIRDMFILLKEDSKKDEYPYTLLRKFIIKNSSNFKAMVLPFLTYNKVLVSECADEYIK